MYKLLALDQSSRVTGYAIFYDDKLHTCGTFTADSDDVGNRLYQIRKEVGSLIDDYDIDEVAFEDIQLQSNVVNNVATFKILAEVFGVIYELLVEMKIPFTVVSSNSWKSTLGIKGKSRPEQKKNAQNYVLNTYNVNAVQDACDAVCIGAHVIDKSREKQPFNWA